MRLRIHVCAVPKLGMGEAVIQRALYAFVPSKEAKSLGHFLYYIRSVRIHPYVVVTG